VHLPFAFLLGVQDDGDDDGDDDEDGDRAECFHSETQLPLRTTLDAGLEDDPEPLSS
jgi:hypothetical protein